VLLDPFARAAGLVPTGQFNVGQSEENYCVPGLGLHRDVTDRVWYLTAAPVVEIVSPLRWALQEVRLLRCARRRRGCDR
jgi:hypothetical protein